MARSHTTVSQRSHLGCARGTAHQRVLLVAVGFTNRLGVKGDGRQGELLRVMHVEALGGRARRAVLGGVARGKGARDGTKYGRSRTSARTFYQHHTQQLSVAAAIGDVMGIHKAVQNKKQAFAAGRACDASAEA